MARLVLQHQGHKSEYPISGDMMIGRQATNDIVVLAEKASRQHAKIIAKGGQYAVEDLKSANGTFVNGKKVKRRKLKHGDEIRIGEAVLTFHDKRAASLEGRSLANYRIHNKIGEGAMGSVYKATQVSMDRIVALKVLKEDLTRDRDFLRAFLNEARTAGKLNHPNVVRVHDFGDVGGIYYFSMEYVNGHTVGATLEHKGKLEVGQALDTARDVASALEHAHGLGILHRDVKPENILVDRRGQVKLTDLGLARAVHDTSDRRKGTIMGTPHYLAPETAQHRKYDERSDIYSLGATLFHMVTGRVPFEGEGSLAVITKHIHEPLPSPRDVEPGVPESVCRLIECMMAKNPALRPTSAKELIRDIDEAKRGMSAPSAAPPKDRRPSSKDSRPRPAPRSESARARVESKRSPAAAVPSAAAPRRRVVFVSRGSPVLYALFGALVVAIVAVIVWVSVQKKAPTNIRSHPGRGINGSSPPARAPSSPMTDAEARDKIGQARQAMANGSNARAESILRDVIKRTSDRDVKSKAWELLGTIRSGGGAGAAGANAEEEAARQLASIKSVIRANRDNPQGKVWGTRQLLRLIQAYRRTSAAVEAARLYRELAGDSIPPEVEQMMKSVGPGQSRSTAPPRKLTPAEALARARETVAEAEDRQDYHAARAALLRFIEDHGGSPEMTEAAETLDRLDMRVRRHLANVYGRAKALSQQSKFAGAGALLGQIISEDPIGKDRGLAEALLGANKVAARKAYERALAQARPYLDRCAFERAAGELRSSAARLAGTEWESALSATAEAAEVSAAAIESLGKKIAAHKGKPLQLRVDFRGRPATASLTGAGPAGLKVRRGGIRTLVPWKDLSTDDLFRAFELFPLTAEQYLGLGALLFLRGERALARRELSRAMSADAQSGGDRAAREKAVRLLGQLDRGLKLKRLDFSQFQDALELDLEGQWSIRGGRLAHDDSQIGSARLRNVEYRAEGFALSFEVVFLGDEGAIEVQLGAQSDRCVWFNLGSTGYQARCTVGGRSTEVQGPWTMTKGKPHAVSCGIRGGALSVTVGGKACKTLKHPALGRIEGPVTFRAQGTRLALDNIRACQGGPAGR